MSESKVSTLDHGDCKYELNNQKSPVEDSPEVKSLRDGKDYVALGKALSNQLRYNEAVECFSKALKEKPDTPDILKLRADKYLATLHLENALLDYKRCLKLGGDPLEIHLSIGICFYLGGEYEKAMRHFSTAYPLASDDTAIAIIYWHSLSALRAGLETGLLGAYKKDMDIRQNTAFHKAVGFLSGDIKPDEYIKDMRKEKDDLDFSVKAYLLSVYLRNKRRPEEATILEYEILKRDGAWPSFAFTALYNDRKVKKGKA